MNLKTSSKRDSFSSAGTPSASRVAECHDFLDLVLLYGVMQGLNWDAGLNLNSIVYKVRILCVHEESNLYRH